MLFNDFSEIIDMIGDMGCIYESLKEIKVLMIKKFDIKDFDLVVEWKGESKKRIVLEMKDENFKKFEKKVRWKN